MLFGKKTPIPLHPLRNFKNFPTSNLKIKHPPTKKKIYIKLFFEFTFNPNYPKPVTIFNWLVITH